MEHQWNALGALANSVLRQAAEAREQSVAQLRDAEAGHGAAACQRRAQSPARLRTEAAESPRQLELPFA